MRKVFVQQPNMGYALAKCVTLNAIITCRELGHGVSIHGYDGQIFYSDGRKIADSDEEAFDSLSEMKWNKWYVIGYLEEDDLSGLKRVHTLPRRDEPLYFEKEFNNFLGHIIYRELC